MVSIFLIHYTSLLASKLLHLKAKELGKPPAQLFAEADPAASSYFGACEALKRNK